MSAFRESRFWLEGLAPQATDSQERADHRANLAQSYLSLRANALLLAGEIARDLPDFTVHDGEHLDALWSLATDIAGEEIQLTPTETYVFGGAVLLHDLGLAAAAYPGGEQALRDSGHWDDALAVVLFHRLGRYPTASELASPDPEDEKGAVELILRERHAERAEELGLVSWDHQGDQIYLIESLTLRTAYGWLIGRIAGSHWWSLERLATELREPANPPAGYPSDWRVDGLTLACLLRLADAAHLDARRAPPLLRAVRRPSSGAALHWAFQERIHLPTVLGDRLMFTSGSPFEATDAPAWWLGFDLLQIVDAEARGVDDLRSDIGAIRFQARGVKSADNPRRLAELIRTSGWEPVDASIHVGDVGSLVEGLGGAHLYGSDPNVPLRELIQNASDAVRARHTLEDGTPEGPEITVAVSSDDDGPFIEITDRGIGMTEELLATKLLDFGASLWRSPDLPRLVPDLAGRGFQPTGRFGIGFFSVLMWGNRVEVTTRSIRASATATRVLELTDGVHARPIIRLAESNEQMTTSGTRVRVWLDLERDLSQPPGTDMKSVAEVTSAGDLAAICAHLAPTLDVGVNSRFANSDAVAVAASDWLTLSGDDLLIRTNPRGRSHAGPRVRPMVNTDGAAIGRAALDRGRSAGVLSVGGLRASETFPHVVGVVAAGAPNLARDSAVPLVEPEAFRVWLEEQLRLMESTDTYVPGAAATALAYSCAVGELPLALRETGERLSASALRAWASGEQEIAVFEEVEFESWLEAHGYSEFRSDEVDIGDDPFLELSGSSMDFSRVGLPPVSPGETTRQLVHEAIADAWDINSTHLAPSRESWFVGMFDDGDEVELDADVYRRE